jgi:hypothetical protein
MCDTVIWAARKNGSAVHPSDAKRERAPMGEENEDVNCFATGRHRESVP